MFQTKITKKIKTHLRLNNFFIENPAVLWSNVEKFRTAVQATDDNMAHAHCMLDT